MAARWTPSLRLSDRAGGCALWLGGRACGYGPTLQDAADDLVVRLLNIAVCLRRTGVTISSEAVADPQWLEFLWELGEIAARGGDIRGRIFGWADPVD
jgi:hypothetical protein